MVKPQNNQSLAKPLRNVWISSFKDSSDIKSFNDKEFKSAPLLMSMEIIWQPLRASIS